MDLNQQYLILLWLFFLLFIYRFEQEINLVHLNPLTFHSWLIDLFLEEFELFDLCIVYFFCFVRRLKVSLLIRPTLTFREFLARSSKEVQATGPGQLEPTGWTKTNRKFLNWSFNCQRGNEEECQDQMARLRVQKQPQREEK